MVLLCPNHHTVIHKTCAPFDYSRLSFCFPNGRVEPLCLNTHLSPRSISEPVLLDLSAPLATPAGAGLVELTRLIVTQLSPDLLSPEWAASRRPEDHPLTGYCYVASEALYHLAGANSSGLSVYRCSLPRGGTHWWLADSDGRIIDPTAQQFSEAPPYSSGIRTFFLSRKPSGRTSRLIARVQSQLGQP